MRLQECKAVLEHEKGQYYEMQGGLFSLCNNLLSGAPSFKHAMRSSDHQSFVCMHVNDDIILCRTGARVNAGATLRALRLC